MVRAEDLLPHPHQAAGHPGSLMISPDGTKVGKPGLPREIAFYESLAAELEARLPEGKRWTGWRPGYHGRVEGAAVDGKQLILIENLTPDAPDSGGKGYRHPTLVDLKVGTQLWDEGATPEKRERMDRVSRETTTGLWGLRVTGGQIWRPDAKRHEVVPKEFGLELDPSGTELFAALARFFPVTLSDTSASDSRLVSTPNSLAPRLALALLKAQVVPRLDRLIDHLGLLEWRVYGDSVLIVYEASPEDLERKLAAGGEGAADVRMIDFAHAWDAKGSGPDEGLLKGLCTIRRLLGELVEELEKVSPAP